MVTASVTVGSCEAGRMVPVAVNVISSAPGIVFASRMAWRRLPGPASLVLVTTSDTAPAGLGMQSSSDRSAKVHRAS